MKWAALAFSAVLLNVAAAGSLHRVSLLGLQIRCETGEKLEDLQPYSEPFSYSNPLEYNFPLVDFYIYNCAPPAKTYAESFEKLNLPVSRATHIIILDMPQPLIELTDEMFEGVPFDTLIMNISNVEYKFKTKRNDNFTGIKFSDLVDVTITCQGDTLEEKPKSFFIRTLKMSTNGRMSIRSCSFPKKSYAYFMMRQLNLSPDSVKELELKLPPTTKSLNFSVLHELVVRKLTLVGEGKHNLEYTFLQSLNSLEEISVSYMKFPSFPNESNIQTTSLKHGESTDAFGGCSKLKKLHLKKWEVPNMLSWLGRCINLQEVYLDLMSETTVNITLNNLTMITTLNVTNSNLWQLDGSLLVDAINLRKLNLQSNSLEQIDKDAFKSQKRLEELDLSRNLLKKWIFADYPQLVSLKKLILDKNHRINFCDNGAAAANSTPLPIEYISARYMEEMRLCFTHWSRGRLWDNLAVVDFSHNNDRYPFEINLFPVPHKRDLTIDIRHNPLKGFSSIVHDDYNTTKSKFRKAHKLTIKTNMPPVDCDCNYGWLGKTLRELPHVTLEGAVCAEDAHGPSRSISANDPKHQECYKFPCNKCTCRMDFYTLQVRADCRRAGLTEIPRNWTFVKGLYVAYLINKDRGSSWYYEEKLSGQTMNLTEILASDNKIKTIGMDDIPATVELLDLRNNAIDRLDESVMAAMFKLPSRRFLLSGNPIVCDCKNRPMVIGLSEHRGQVADYTKLQCIGSAKPLSMSPPNDLCVEENKKQVLIAAVSCTSLLALLVATTALYYRYRQFIKVYLYARGLCLCCVREEEADADRPFDAFISFSHEDDELITEKILLHIENDYELCMHTRTWVPGEMIHSQILRSVADSRRTVIILSRNFVKSIWGMVEFRTAYDSALREGRVRVIVVVVDDVIEDEDLDPELKGYLKTNTYLKIDDPWFLKKLRYALPHRSSKLVGKVNESEFKSERRSISSNSSRLDSPPILAVNNLVYHDDLNSDLEEHEMTTNYN